MLKHKNVLLVLGAVAAIIFWLPQLYHRERAVKVARPASTANAVFPMDEPKQSPN